VGVTLIEMLIVVAIVGLMVGIMFPAVSSGIDTLRLQQAAEGIAGFVNTGLNRAERRQEAVEITIAKASNEMIMRSAEQAFEKRLEMPEGVRIADVLPETPEDPNAPRHYILYPGGAPPRLGVVLLNRRGDRRTVRLDPITGVSQVAR
jgi:prepilin-type N-terminal cleavage/methylation domain-containing protein